MSVGSESEAGRSVVRALAAFHAADGFPAPAEDFGRRTMARIDVGIERAHAAGKLPVRVFVGGEACAAMLKQFGNLLMLRMVGGPGGYMYGNLIVNVRPTLVTAVIVEASDGEPFIVTDDLP